MIWGSQYDQMIIWMQRNGLDVTSETPKDFDGTATSKNTTRDTGTVSTDNLNNIYDLLGNSQEWTLEVSITGARTSRGGGCDRSFSPSYRTNIFNPYRRSTSNSTRLTLYIK